MTTAHTATIESKEFYELMQAYRHAQDIPQSHVVEAYQSVIDFVDARIAAHDELVKALQKTLAALDGKKFTVGDRQHARAALAKAGAA